LPAGTVLSTLAPIVRTGSLRAIDAVLIVAGASATLLVLAATRALPPADLDTAGLAWIVPSLSGLVAAAAAALALACLVAGLRRGEIAAFLAASSAAAVAGAALTLLLTGETHAVGLALAAGGVLGLAAAAVPRGRSVNGRRGRVVAAVAGLLLAEVAVVAASLPALMPGVAAWRDPLLVAAAGTAGVAAIGARDRWHAAAAGGGAIGAIGFLVDRGAGMEVVIGLIGLVGASLAGLRAVVARWTPAVAASLASDTRLPALAHGPADAVLHFGAGLRIQPADGGVVAAEDDGAHREDAERLSRELRGTIEELLQARRTIELQRAELERSSAVDPVTGVASRGALLARLETEIAEARRYRHPVAVVLLDIDGFTGINERHGIGAGDTVLREVALRMRLRVRAADALGRAGSDGFLAVLPHTDEGGAATFAAALRHRLAQRPLLVGDELVTLTVSVGVAVMRAGETLDLDGLLARVGEALDSARAAGGNRIALDRDHGLARLEERASTTEPGEPKTQDSGH
jgi:diguanylate cyclase (GGDEF)-like protein